MGLLKEVIDWFGDAEAFVQSRYAVQLVCMLGVWVELWFGVVVAKS